MLLQILIFGSLAAVANVLGGLILFPSRLRDVYKRFLRYLLALSAGFMLAVTFLEIFPRTLELWESPNHADGHTGILTAMMLVLAGYLITQFFEHTIAPHFHLGEEVHSHDMLSPTSAYTAVGGLLIHTFFDGVSIAAASMLDHRVGFLVFIAVFLHKFPEGFTIGSMILAAGKSRTAVLAATGLVGIATLTGALGFYFVGAATGFSVAYALPIAGGVTLYVAASDLIPEVNHHGGKNPMVSISVFLGVAIFFGAQTLMHSVFGH